MLTYRIKTRLHHRINKAGEQSIIIRVTFNKCRVDLETGLTIAASKWDDKVCEAKRWKIQCKLPPKTKAILPP